MVADIFYLMFTLKITVLAYFIQKKKSGTSPPPEHHPGPPGCLTAPPIPLAAKKKQKTMHPYFFSFSPLSPGSVGLH